MDSKNPTIGFLRHPILFAVSVLALFCDEILNPPFEQALRHFAISPSSAIDATSNMSTRSGYAKQCGVNRVTLESIAYAATMVMFGHLPIAIANAVSRFALR